MTLDELQAAAERVLADHAKCGNGNHASARCVDAIALATFVRDTFSGEPFQWALRRKDGRSIYADAEMHDALIYDTEREARDYLAAWDSNDDEYEINPIYEVERRGASTNPTRERP